MKRKDRDQRSERPPKLPPEPALPHFVRREPRRRGRRAAKVVGSVVATGATLIATTVAGVLLHLGVPPARRLAAAAVTQILTGTFRGKIEIVRIGRLEPNRIDDAVVTLLAPDGTRVAQVEGIRSRIALFPLLSSLILRRDMRLDVTELSVDHIDALLAPTPEGSLTIAQSFLPATRRSPPPPDSKAGAIDLSIDTFRLTHAWVHGTIGKEGTIDGELGGIEASFRMTSEHMDVDVRDLHLLTRGLPQHADVIATLQAHLFLPVTDVAAHVKGALDFKGTVGGVALALHGNVEGKHVDGSLDVPRVEPAELAQMFDASPLRQPATVHVEAHGDLPNVEPELHLAIGTGSVDVRGHLTLPSEGERSTRATMTIAARNLDARVASKTAPATDLALDASATANVDPEGAIDGSYALHLLPGSVGANATPDVRITGTATPTSVRGAAHVAQPGAPADISFAIAPRANDGPDIAIDATLRADDLSKLPRIAGRIGGAARVHASARLALRSKRIDARVQTEVHELTEGSIRIDRAMLQATATGTLEAPTATVSVSGSGLHAGAYAFSAFGASAKGTPREVEIHTDLKGDGNASVSVEGTLGTTGTLSAKAVTVHVTKETDAATARIALARIDGPKVDVDGLRIEGIGQPIEGELHRTPSGGVTVRLQAPEVDVPKVLRLAGMDAADAEGHVGIDVDLHATKRSTDGRASIDLRKIHYGELVRGLDAKAFTTFEGSRVTAHVDARDALNDALKLDTEDGRLGAGALDPRAWTEATGRARGTVTIDLDRLVRALGGKLPFEELRGWLATQLEVTRDEPKRRPTLAIDASTHDLSFITAPKKIESSEGTQTVVGKSVRSVGVDMHVKARVDAESGVATFDTLLRDKVGELVAVNASSTLPMNAILAGDAKSALLTTPVKAHVEMPRRSFASLPEAIGKMPVRGSGGFALDVEGSAREPKVKLVVHAQDVMVADDPTPVPIGGDATITYDGEKVTALIGCVRHQGKVLDARATMTLRASDLLAGTPRWEANADATFSKFPIGAVAGFADENNFDGDLSGTLALHDLHESGRLDVDLDLAHLNINGANFGEIKATVSARDGAITAAARMNQPDGFAEVHGSSGMKWGDAIAPSFDERRPIDVALRAKNFRVAMIAPFVRSVASELDGRLNADTKLHIVPGLKDGAMNGAVLLDDGLFETPVIGEEFHNLRARIFMRPWGVWNVEDVSGDGTSGHFKANAVAHVEGLRLRSAEAHLTIAEKDKLPLTMQGVELGTVWGQIDTKAALASDAKTLNVDVNAPTWHIDLPQSIAHGVQSTSPDPTIKVGSIGRDGKVVLVPFDGSEPPPESTDESAKATPPLNLHVVTHLGPDFEVRRGSMLRAFVTKGPTIDIGSETKLSGQLEIPRGYVELQGKRFQIEKGSLNFTGQPTDDPVAIATAMYESPDGTKVYADFVGPVQTGKLTLRSEPALSQNEILALLLFGTADGTFGQAAPPGQQGNNATQAASLAGGVVTEGLNKAISGISGVEMQTKVDTELSGDPRPEVEVALSRSVSATIVYNLGVPPPGQNPDDTLLMVDWRFHKNYSTKATLGDRGTSILDLTWKYRY